MNKKNLFHFIIFIFCIFLSSCMTLSKTDVNVLGRDSNNMLFFEKLEAYSWILSQYPDNTDIRQKRAVLYYNIGLFSYSLEDCGYIIDNSKDNEEIKQIFDNLNTKEIEIDVDKWFILYNSAKQGYSNYLKGLFYIQCNKKDNAINELLISAKKLPNGFFKINTNILIGDIYYEDEMYEKALSFYKKANKLYSKNVMLHIKMLEIYLKQENISFAEKELKTIADLTGDKNIFLNAKRMITSEK